MQLALLSTLALLAVADAAPRCIADRPLLAGGRIRVTLLPRQPCAACNRTFTLRLPDTVSSAAVVLAVHGAFQNSSIFLDGGAAPLDTTFAAAGWVTVAPDATINAALAFINNATNVTAVNTLWGATAVPTDPGFGAQQGGAVVDELAFLWEALTCVQDTLGVNLTGDVLALGHSQGAKLASRLGCSQPAPGFAVRAVVANAGLFASPPDAPACDGIRPPPPLLALQANNDLVLPFCAPGLVYAEGALYWGVWASAFNGCGIEPAAIAGGAGLLMVPQSPALCNGSRQPAGATTFVRAYVPGAGCTAPQALVVVNEGDDLGHKLAGSMAGLNGRDAVALAIQFFQAQLQAAPNASVAERLSFLTAGLAPCAVAAGECTADAPPPPPPPQPRQPLFDTL